MYLIVRPFYGPGHDSSAGERMNITVCPPCGPGSNPRRGAVLHEIFPWPIPLHQSVLTANGPISPHLPHNLWTSRKNAKSNHEQTMTEK